MRRKYCLIILLVLALCTANSTYIWSDAGLSENQQSCSAFTEAINKAISDIYHIEINPIEYPSQGDFMWCYQNLNQVFNEGTFNYISARVMPGTEAETVELFTAGSFPNAYNQVISSIYYTLSINDAEWLNEAQKKATAYQMTVVSDYEADFGKITDNDMAKAREKYGTWVVNNKFDYIITVIIGVQWSGQEQPLTYQEMADGDLKALLPKAPSNAGRVIADVQHYFDMMKPINLLLEKIQLNSWVIYQLKSNTMYPSDANGGMKTVNPNTGVVSTGLQPGYTVMRSVSDIESDLNNNDRILRVEIPFSGSNAANRSELSISKGGIFNYAMQSVPGGSEDITIVLEYQGYTLIPITPVTLSIDSGAGWYFGYPISEAYKNGKQDVTGFKFVSEPAYNLGTLSQGGNFGYITNLLICNCPPTITVNYKNADFTKFKEFCDKSAEGNLTLLGGINLGGYSDYTYSGNILQGSSNSNFSVTFSPSQENIEVPLMQSAAYVIGGTFEFPAGK